LRIQPVFVLSDPTEAENADYADRSRRAVSRKNTKKYDESMKPPSNVQTPAQYIASLPADRAKTIATVRAVVNKHIPRG
jgi:hypothetical protein